MKDRMIDRHLRTPLKVDAGAIWDRKPEKESTARPVEREFIFDFDMNDYDDVRTCCEGKKVCRKCWRLLVIAVEILEKCLADDYDFHQLMYVFSGGRGLHIWVCDKKAREMKDSLRKCLVDYLELVTGNEKAASLLSDHVINRVDDKENNIWKSKMGGASRDEVKDYYIANYVHAHVERSLNILNTHFVAVMEEQQVFAVNEEDRQFKHPKCIELMLRIIAHRNEKLRDRVQEKWNRLKGSDARKMIDEMELEVIRYETTQTVEEYAKGYQPDGKVYRLTFIRE
jgi:DNA primase catalytic subunit